MEQGVDVHGEQRLPFDIEFQAALIRLLCEDAGFGAVVGKHLKGEYFEDEGLAWAWRTAQAHEQRYGDLPSVPTLRQYAMMSDPRLRQLHYATAVRIERTPVRDEQFMRDSAVDFCKRNIFTATVRQCAQQYNSGRVEDAYEQLARATDELEKATWRTPDATYFFDDLARRNTLRLCGESSGYAVATAIHELDRLLGGGLKKGELGTWISYPKVGKSTMLLTMGVAATRSQMRPTAHFIFEGARKQAEDRYEAAFTQEAYQEVRTRGLESSAFRDAWEQYQYLRGLLWLQAMVEEWDYTAIEITESLRAQKRAKNWTPDLVIVDYGDLLSGRHKPYRSEQQKQKDAFRDLKMLASRGYALWTASQVQRPKEGAEDDAHWIFARQIADCYEKVRVCDFIGSLNQTNAERKHKVMRIFAELYRDNEANLRFLVSCDFSVMRIASGKDLWSPSMADLQSGTGLGMQDKGRTPKTADRPQQLTAPLT
ncbi:MAG: hypothetical protein JSU89_15770 [Myxococcales bacterium]|nr:MAG: hypothetical protein JSU89_15770 [Myxococcales bacterium]